MRTRHLSWWVLSMTVLAALAIGAAAWGEAAKKEDAKAGPTVTPPPATPPATEPEMQQPGNEEPKTGPLILTMYRVEDLEFVKRDWSARSLGLPDVLEGEKKGADYPGHNSGGLFGGSPEAGHGIGDQELIDIIKRTVSATSNPKVAAWSDEGGPAMIDYLPYGGASVLIVTQTREGQKQVESMIEALRSASEVGGPMLMIHVQWAEMADAKAAELIGRDPAKRQVPMEVAAADLAKADAKTIYRGCTTCFDRQTVFVASGNLKAYLADVTPLICEAFLGNTPVIRNLLVGGMLEVRPQLSKDKDAVLLDYRSYVNPGATVEHKLHQGSTKAADVEGRLVPEERPTIELDLPAVDFQTLRGSVRIPLGKSILLGFTTGPKLKDGKVSCLIVEVSASKAETRP